MKIEEITSKDNWNKLYNEIEEKTFCQSWNWGEFNKKMGDSAWRFCIKDGETVVAIAQVIKISARRGSFLLVPHGPLFFNQKDRKEVLKVFHEYLTGFAKDKGVVFIRMAPLLERNEENVRIFTELGFKNAPIHIHPELTWELNLLPSEEKLLLGMRKTTRYLIRQGEKNEDLVIEKSQSFKDLEAFEEVYQITADRHSFTPFSMSYLKNELESFKDDDEIVIFSGKYKGEIVASAMVIYCDNGAYYHQGASSLKYPKVPVSYLVQWEAIKEGKKRNCKTYNFWGIAPESELEANKDHPWRGLSLFKKGFGGYKKEYVKTQDFPLTFRYWFTYLFEELRKRKRNL